MRGHAGRWIAWTPDLDRIVASSVDPLEVRARVREAGIDGLVYEWIPPLDV